MLKEINWVQMFAVQRPHARVFLVLRECIWNATAVSLVLPTFDDADSLGSPPRQMVYLPDSTPGDCLQFPCGE